jgi:hypothetical protein
VGGRAPAPSPGAPRASCCGLALACRCTAATQGACRQPGVRGKGCGAAGMRRWCWRWRWRALPVSSQISPSQPLPPPMSMSPITTRNTTFITQQFTNTATWSRVSAAGPSVRRARAW